MALRLLVTFQAKPGMAPDFAKAWAPNITETLKEPGCEQYELFISQADPDKLVLLERWSSAEDLEVHMGVLRARGPSPTAPFRAEGSTPSMERFEVE